jgi:TonB family protein
VEYRQYQHRNLCAVLALLGHIIVLCPLFLSFVAHQRQQQRNELTNPLPAINAHLHPTLSAPVVLYSGSIGKSGQAAPAPKSPPPSTTDDDKQGSLKTEPGHSGATKGVEQKTAAQKITPEPKPKSIKEKRILKAHFNGPILPARKSDQEIAQPITEIIKEQKETQEKESEQTAEIPSMFQAAEKPFEQEQQNDPNGLRKRRLTLSDLFRTMPHLMNKLSKESEQGDQLVVVQGDMKYYTFLKVFLTHINQVFAFHGGPQKMHDFAQDGKLKKNAGLSVVIDRQGKVLSHAITHSSGHQPADELITQAVDLASPFPPVPPHFTHKTVRIELVSVVR